IKPIYIFPSVLKGEQYGDEFGKVSIIRKVPVLKDGDFILREGVLPAVTGAPVPKEKMDAAVKDLKVSLKTFEDKFLQSRPFIIGDKISVADLVAIVEMMQPVGTGLDVFQGRPVLSAWRDRVKKEIGVEVFDEAHKVIMNVDTLPQTFENKGLPEFLKLRIQKMFN
ncbi:hypothetical protein cypCar_00001876, partial [Cyprinus carpio]